MPRNAGLLYGTNSEASHCKSQQFAVISGSAKHLAKIAGSKSFCAGTQAAMSQCPEYDRLSSQVDEILKKLADTTTLQLEIFRSRKPGEFMRVDKELELLVGEKERRFGAMRQHADEHKCQRNQMP